MITKSVTCLKWRADPKEQDVFWLKVHKGLIAGENLQGGESVHDLNQATWFNWTNFPY